MKKYKTSEAIAMLEQNPKEKYTSMCSGNKYELSASGMSGNYFVFTAYNRNGEKIEPHIPAGGFNYNIPLDLEWELIQQPADFLTAVKAYSEGKTIRCEHTGDTYIYKPYPECDELGMMLYSNGYDPIRVKEILEGKWFIEEGEHNE